MKRFLIYKGDRLRISDNWSSDSPWFKNCPVIEKTGDGIEVGRCWYYLTGGICPRHGDIQKEVQHEN